MKSLSNALFWLTGASSGIGYAVAKELAEQNAGIIISSRNADKIDDKISELKELGATSVETVALDLSDGKFEKKIKDILQARKLNGVLLNGGGFPGKKTSEHAFQDFIEGNKIMLAGPAQFLLNILPYMKHHKSSVVAITSTSVKEPIATLDLSAIYRSGLVIFLKNLAHEIGHTGIRINNVAPGATSTEHLEKIIEKTAHNNKTSVKEVRSQWENRAALKRMAKPEEIAKVVCFLMSKDASFINGQTIVVDGCSTKSYL